MAAMPHTQDSAELRALEAARYLLLRRLALSMRHQMVVHLQPMGMIADLLERRLAAPQPDAAQVRECITRIHGLSRQAVDACLDVVGWLAPAPGACVPLQQGVQECVDLLRSSFSFRGFALVSDVAVGEPVGQAGLRNAFSAALLALAEEAPSPAELRITASAAPEGASITLQLHAGVGEPVVPGGSAPRDRMGWAEVERLAGAEGVRVEHSATGARLVFPRAPRA
jgi:hypothetical protein